MRWRFFYCLHFSSGSKNSQLPSLKRITLWEKMVIKATTAPSIYSNAPLSWRIYGVIKGLLASSVEVGSAPYFLLFYFSARKYNINENNNSYSWLPHLVKSPPISLVFSSAHPSYQTFKQQNILVQTYSKNTLRNLWESPRKEGKKRLQFYFSLFDL